MPLPELLWTSLAVSLPTFGWVALGLVLRRIGWLDQQRVDRVSLWCFNLGLPLLLFLGAAQLDYREALSARYLWAGMAAAVLVVALAWAYGRFRGWEGSDFGVFVQAAFRSNLGIVGTALVLSAYGSRGLLLAALPVAVMTALYNVLAVWLLNRTHQRSSRPGAVAAGILRNPLIIGILLGSGVAVLPFELPQGLIALAGPFSAVFLPVMLVCVGASLSVASLRQSAGLSAEAVIWRLCIAPLVTLSLALALGVRGETLGALFLLTASPVASASFIMVLAVGGNGKLAANLIVLTTVLSPFSVTIGYFLLGFAGLL